MKLRAGKVGVKDSSDEELEVDQGGGSEEAGGGKRKIDGDESKHRRDRYQRKDNPRVTFSVQSLEEVRYELDHEEDTSIKNVMINDSDRVNGNGGDSTTVIIGENLKLIDSRRFCILVFGSIMLLIFGLAYGSSKISSITQKKSSDSNNNKKNNSGIGGGWRPKTPRPTTIFDDIETSLPCIPQICRGPERLIDNEREWKNHSTKEFIVLATVPGGGGTWIRSLVRKGTRIQSGSVYSDEEDLEDAHFKDNLVENIFQHEYCPVSIIKTHWPLVLNRPGEALNEKVTFALHLIRSPFDTFLAEFNHQFGENEPPLASVAVFEKHWNDWIRKRMYSWKRMMETWSVPRFWEHDHLLKQPAPGVHYFTVEKPLAGPEKRNITVLNMFYDDYNTDFVGSTMILFEFLKKRFGNIMPSIRDAIICSLILDQWEHVRYPDSLPSKLVNPFISKSGKRSPFTAKLCSIYNDYWYTEKWANCEDGVLQSHRKRKQRGYILPDEYCNE